MARYRLKTAHMLFTREGHDVYVAGDAETNGNGEVVGDGTAYVVKWPTLEMEPLDEEAEAALDKERERLAMNDASMNPIDELPLEMDSYEANYVPGLNIRRRPAKPDGAPVRESSDA